MTTNSIREMARDIKESTRYISEHLRYGENIAVICSAIREIEYRNKFAFNIYNLNGELTVLKDVEFPTFKGRSILKKDLKNEKIRIQIAKLASNYCTLGLTMKALDIGSEAIRKELAAKGLNNDPRFLLENIHCYNLSPKVKTDLLLEQVSNPKIAEEVIAGSSLTFNFPSEYSSVPAYGTKKAYQLAKKVANAAPEAAAKHFSNFNLQGKHLEMYRYEIADIIAEADPKAAAKYFKSFDLHDERKVVLERTPESAFRNLSQPEKSQQTLRLKSNIIRKIIEKDPAAAAEHFDKFEIKDEQTRSEFALMIIDKAPQAAAEHFEKFGFKDIQERFQHAAAIASKDAAAAAEHFTNFGFSYSPEDSAENHRLKEDFEFRLAKLIIDSNVQIDINPIIKLMNQISLPYPFRIDLYKKIAKKYPQEYSAYAPELGHFSMNVNDQHSIVVIVSKYAPKESAAQLRLEFRTRGDVKAVFKILRVIAKADVTALAEIPAERLNNLSVENLKKFRTILQKESKQQAPANSSGQKSI